MNGIENDVLSADDAAGIFLPKLCELLKDNPRRRMFETLSSGFVAPAPGSLPPPSEPTPAPGSEPATASEPAPGSEQFLDLLPQQSLDRVGYSKEVWRVKAEHPKSNLNSAVLLSQLSTSYRNRSRHRT
ncbi:hypothetical protein EJ110_NYTH03349 [Nymphaea thermarum]|nr:hypothetical protein EJ110_NYTH03349 [Nymphaea thermarum]